MSREVPPPIATPRARAMRHEPTEAERRLWLLLRDRRLQGIKSRRQVPFGPFIADFVCHSHKLIVEADGSQHAENPRDDARDAWFAARGYEVARFWNLDILREPERLLATVAARLGLPW